jgi:hypothetical protein
LKSLILSVLFIIAGIVFSIVGVFFKSGRILNNELGKKSGIFALAIGGFTLASGILLAILPEVTDILALSYVILITILLFIMIAILNKKN